MSWENRRKGKAIFKGKLSLRGEFSLEKGTVAQFFGKLQNGLLTPEVPRKRQKPPQMEENHPKMDKTCINSEFPGVPLKSPESEVEKRLLRNLAQFSLGRKYFCPKRCLGKLIGRAARRQFRKKVSRQGTPPYHSLRIF